MEKIGSEGKTRKDLMKLLGIDFGLKNIGLAMSEGFLVEPLGVVKNVKRIDRICQEHKIEKIIIGLSEGEMAKKTRVFGEKLARQTNLPVEYQDETLTSEEAKRLMIKIGKPKKKRQEQADAIAASLILQAYLERKD